MRAAAKKRGILITSISRPICPTDFRDFDLILAMDMQNKGRRISIIVYYVFMGLLLLFGYLCFVLVLNSVK